MLGNVKVLKRISFLYAREFQVLSGFGVIGNLPGKANVRYFLSERSLSKRGLKLLQRCNKKTQRCIYGAFGLGKSDMGNGWDFMECCSLISVRIGHLYNQLKKPEIEQNSVRAKSRVRIQKLRVCIQKIFRNTENFATVIFRTVLSLP